MPKRIRVPLGCAVWAAIYAILSRFGSLGQEKVRVGRMASADLRVALGWPVARVAVEGGVTLHVDLRDEGVGRPLYVERAYEPAETRFLTTFLKPEMTFLDVGANIGYYTALAGRLVGAGGRVVAVEPEPHNFSLLTRNIAANKLISNVTAVNVALGASAGTVSLHCSSSNFGDHRVEAGGNRHTTTQVVPITTMDRLAEQSGLRSIDLIKMDVQGYEPAVVAGMRGVLAANPRVAILTEFWPYGITLSGGNTHQLFGMLTAAGFEARLLTAEGGLGQAVDHEGALAQIPRFDQPDSSYINILFLRPG